MACDGAPIISEYASDPDLKEIVEMFVAELPCRIQDFSAAARKGNHAELRSLAHQMRGSAGGYGFQQITEQAADLEERLKRGESAANVERALTSLIDLCRRAALSKQG